MEFFAVWGLTVFEGRGIVRFFAADEAAVMKRRSIARFGLSRIGYSDTVAYLIVQTLFNKTDYR